MTIWSVILNRIDNAFGSPPWKEWRGQVITSSTGAADAGAIPMLDDSGQLDPSMVPGGSSGIELETNGTPNFVQSTLNLTAGQNIGLTSDDEGAVTIAALALSYFFQQSTPASTWTITHNLNRNPSVVVTDSSGREVFGDITFNSSQQLTIVFSAPFSGTATCN